MRTATASLLLMILAACSGAEMHSGAVGAGTGSSNNADEGNQTPPDTTSLNPNPSGTSTDPDQHNFSGSGPTVQDPDTASIPVAIGGASLTCSITSPQNYQATCFASKDGKPFDFKVTRAFYHLPNKGWVPTQTAPTVLNPGSYRVQLTAETASQSVAIALANDQSETLADWVIDPSNPPQLAIQDGSFEDHIIDMTSQQTNDATHFVQPTQQTYWKAKTQRSDGAGACEAVIELSSAQVDSDHTPAKAGNQYTELDSICHASNPMYSSGDNILLYQALNLVVDHYYEVSFSFRHRATNNTVASYQGFTFKFGETGEMLTATIQATENNWVTYKALVKATKASSRISFQEIGSPDDGIGTFLDDVKVIDIGELPQ